MKNLGIFLVIVVLMVVGAGFLIATDGDALSPTSSTANSTCTVVINGNPVHTTTAPCEATSTTANEFYVVMNTGQVGSYGQYTVSECLYVSVGASECSEYGIFGANQIATQQFSFEVPTGLGGYNFTLQGVFFNGNNQGQTVNLCSSGRVQITSDDQQVSCSQPA